LYPTTVVADVRRRHRGDYTPIMQPTQLGPYTIDALLGRGGMGAVYEATDGRTGERVAVKTLAAHLGDDPAMQRRFLAEIDTLKALRHPCIVRLLAFGDDDGVPFFAMELVRGRSLERLLRAGRRFDWRETVEIGLAITRALKSAHDHGVVHRDLKPANLLFRDAPDAEAPVKLADFGIAKLFGAAGETVAGTVVGTAEYMAPEQAAGHAVDHRVDLYALGLVLYTMLAGRPPFRGGEVRDVLRRQQTETPPRLTAVAEGVPPELDDLVARLLAKDPRQRPASALAVGRLLSAIAGSGAAAQPTTRPLDAAGPATAAAPALDLLGATRATHTGDTTPAPLAVLPDPASGHRADAEAVTMPIADGSGTAARARQTTDVDSTATTAARPAVGRFVTLEDLHRASREEERSRWWRDAVARVVTGLGIAGVLAAGGFFLLTPPTADALHGRILAIAADPEADLRDARPLIEAFLTAHGDDPRAPEVRDVARTLDLDMLERRSRRRRDDDDALPALEREYRGAMAREQAGAAACIAALEAVLALHADDPGDPAAEAALPLEQRASLWLDLVRRQIERLEPRARADREEDARRIEAALAEAAALASEAAGAAAGDRDRLLERRRDLLVGIIELYAPRPHLDDAVARARSLLAETPSPVPEEPAVP
jgi:serine/threonine-protein kinase